MRRLGWSANDPIADFHANVVISAMKRRSVLLVAGLTATGMCFAALQFLQRTRVVEGTWLWQNEGSDFFESPARGRECEFYKHEPAWLNYDPFRIYPDYTYKRVWPSSGTYDSHAYGPFRIEAFEVKFRGRWRFAPFGAGHLRDWWSEYDVDEMIAVRPIAGLHCMVR